MSFGASYNKYKSVMALMIHLFNVYNLQYHLLLIRKTIYWYFSKRRREALILVCSRWIRLRNRSYSLEALQIGIKHNPKQCTAKMFY